MRKFIGAIAILAGFSSQTLAQVSDYWGEVRGWTIGVDSSLGYGCFIYNAFEGNSYLRVGYDPTSDQIYMILGDSDWNSITEGSAYQLEMQMGRRSKWDAPAVGGRLDGIPTLLVTAGDILFLKELSSQSNIRAWYNGNEISNISLLGSARAIDEMIRCQNAMYASGRVAGDDPFAGAVADPFAN